MTIPSEQQVRDFLRHVHMYIPKDSASPLVLTVKEKSVLHTFLDRKRRMGPLWLQSSGSALSFQDGRQLANWMGNAINLVLSVDIQVNRAQIALKKMAGNAPAIIALPSIQTVRLVRMAYHAHDESAPPDPYVTLSTWAGYPKFLWQLDAWVHLDTDPNKQMKARVAANLLRRYNDILRHVGMNAYR